VTDKLAHVKKLFITVSLDGFGARKYVSLDRLDNGRRYVHQVVMPKLWQAIRADDPEWDPLVNTTEAAGTGAVRLFVSLLECHREFERLGHPYDDIWHCMYQPGPEGCFYDDLTEALAADDPEWTGPAPFEWNPAAVHPNLHVHH
jgi:hypothetical protein